MPDLTISQHAKERYAERIKDINDRSTIAVYVVQNEFGIFDSQNPPFAIELFNAQTFYNA